MVGVPYSDGEIDTAAADMANQAKVISAEVVAQKGPAGLEDKEIIALISYLQRLGTDIKWKRPEQQLPLIAPVLAPTAAPSPTGQAPATTAPAAAPTTGSSK